MKPQFILDIEVNLGLTCVLDVDEKPEKNVYWVLSPTGVKMFKVWAYDGERIGSISQPNMNTIQFGAVEQ
jgi:hypothetical protein